MNPTPNSQEPWSNSKDLSGPKTSDPNAWMLEPITWAPFSEPYEELFLAHQDSRKFSFAPDPTYAECLLDDSKWSKWRSPVLSPEESNEPSFLNKVEDVFPGPAALNRTYRATLLAKDCRKFWHVWSVQFVMRYRTILLPFIILFDRHFREYWLEKQWATKRPGNFREKYKLILDGGWSTRKSVRLRKRWTPGFRLVTICLCLLPLFHPARSTYWVSPGGTWTGMQEPLDWQTFQFREAASMMGEIKQADLWPSKWSLKLSEDWQVQQDQSYMAKMIDPEILDEPIRVEPSAVSNALREGTFQSAEDGKMYPTLLTLRARTPLADFDWFGGKSLSQECDLFLDDLPRKLQDSSEKLGAGSEAPLPTSALQTPERPAWIEEFPWSGILPEIREYGVPALDWEGWDPRSLEAGFASLLSREALQKGTIQKFRELRHDLVLEYLDYRSRVLGEQVFAGKMDVEGASVYEKSREIYIDHHEGMIRETSHATLAAEALEKVQLRNQEVRTRLLANTRWRDRRVGLYKTLLKTKKPKPKPKNKDSLFKSMKFRHSNAGRAHLKLAALRETLDYWGPIQAPDPFVDRRIFFEDFQNWLNSVEANGETVRDILAKDTSDTSELYREYYRLGTSVRPRPPYRLPPIFTLDSTLKSIAIATGQPLPKSEADAKADANAKAKAKADAKAKAEADVKAEADAKAEAKAEAKAKAEADPRAAPKPNKPAPKPNKLASTSLALTPDMPVPKPLETSEEFSERFMEWVASLPEERGEPHEEWLEKMGAWATSMAQKRIVLLKTHKIKGVRTIDEKRRFRIEPHHQWRTRIGKRAISMAKKERLKEGAGETHEEWRERIAEWGALLVEEKMLDAAFQEIALREMRDPLNPKTRYPLNVELIKAEVATIIGFEVSKEGDLNPRHRARASKGTESKGTESKTKPVLAFELPPFFRLSKEFQWPKRTGPTVLAFELPPWFSVGYIWPKTTEPTGTEPTGTEPTGTEPTGTEPKTTESTGTESTGTESKTTETTGTESKTTLKPLAIFENWPDIRSKIYEQYLHKTDWPEEIIGSLKEPTEDPSGMSSLVRRKDSRPDDIPDIYGVDPLDHDRIPDLADPSPSMWDERPIPRHSNKNLSYSEKLRAYILQEEGKSEPVPILQDEYRPASKRAAAVYAKAAIRDVSTKIASCNVATRLSATNFTLLKAHVKALVKLEQETLPAILELDPLSRYKKDEVPADLPQSPHGTGNTTPFVPPLSIHQLSRRLLIRNPRHYFKKNPGSWSKDSRPLKKLVRNPRHHFKQSPWSSSKDSRLSKKRVRNARHHFKMTRPHPQGLAPFFSDNFLKNPWSSSKDVTKKRTREAFRLSKKQTRYAKEAARLSLRTSLRIRSAKAVKATKAARRGAWEEVEKSFLSDMYTLPVYVLQPNPISIPQSFLDAQQALSEFWEVSPDELGLNLVFEGEDIPVPPGQPPLVNASTAVVLTRMRHIVKTLSTPFDNQPTRTLQRDVPGRATRQPLDPEAKADDKYLEHPSSAPWWDHDHPLDAPGEAIGGDEELFKWVLAADTWPIPWGQKFNFQVVSEAQQAFQQNGLVTPLAAERLFPPVPVDAPGIFQVARQTSGYQYPGLRPNGVKDLLVARRFLGSIRANRLVSIPWNLFATASMKLPDPEDSRSAGSALILPGADTGVLQTQASSQDEVSKALQSIWQDPCTVATESLSGWTIQTLDSYRDWVVGQALLGATPVSADRLAPPPQESSRNPDQRIKPTKRRWWREAFFLDDILTPLGRKPRPIEKETGEAWESTTPPPVLWKEIPFEPFAQTAFGAPRALFRYRQMMVQRLIGTLRLVSHYQEARDVCVEQSLPQMVPYLPELEAQANPTSSPALLQQTIATLEELLDELEFQVAFVQEWIGECDLLLLAHPDWMGYEDLAPLLVAINFNKKEPVKKPQMVDLFVSELATAKNEEDLTRFPPKIKTEDSDEVLAAKKKQDDAKRKQDAAKRKKNAAKGKKGGAEALAEDAKKRAEDAKKKVDDAKKKTDDAKSQEGAAKVLAPRIWQRKADGAAKKASRALNDAYLAASETPTPLQRLDFAKVTCEQSPEIQKGLEEAIQRQEASLEKFLQTTKKTYQAILRRWAASDAQTLQRKQVQATRPAVFRDPTETYTKFQTVRQGQSLEDSIQKSLRAQLHPVIFDFYGDRLAQKIVDHMVHAAPHLDTSLTSLETDPSAVSGLGLVLRKLDEFSPDPTTLGPANLEETFEGIWAQINHHMEFESLPLREAEVFSDTAQSPPSYQIPEVTVGPWQDQEGLTSPPRTLEAEAMVPADDALWSLETLVEQFHTRTLDLLELLDTSANPPVDQLGLVPEDSTALESQQVTRSPAQHRLWERWARNSQSFLTQQSGPLGGSPPEGEVCLEKGYSNQLPVSPEYQSLDGPEQIFQGIPTWSNLLEASGTLYPTLHVHRNRSDGQAHWRHARQDGEVIRGSGRSEDEVWWILRPLLRLTSYRRMKLKKTYRDELKRERAALKSQTETPEVPVGRAGLDLKNMNQRFALLYIEPQEVVKRTYFELERTAQAKRDFMNRKPDRAKRPIGLQRRIVREHFWEEDLDFDDIPMVLSENPSGSRGGIKRPTPVRRPMPFGPSSRRGTRQRYRDRQRQRDRDTHTPRDTRVRRLRSGVSCKPSVYSFIQSVPMNMQRKSLATLGWFLGLEKPQPTLDMILDEDTEAAEDRAGEGRSLNDIGEQALKRIDWDLVEELHEIEDATHRGEIYMDEEDAFRSMERFNKQSEEKFFSKSRSKIHAAYFNMWMRFHRKEDLLRKYYDTFCRKVRHSKQVFAIQDFVDPRRRKRILRKRRRAKVMHQKIQKRLAIHNDTYDIWRAGQFHPQGADPASDRSYLREEARVHKPIKNRARNLIRQARFYSNQFLVRELHQFYCVRLARLEPTFWKGSERDVYYRVWTDDYLIQAESVALSLALLEPCAFLWLQLLGYTIKDTKRVWRNIKLKPMKLPVAVGKESPAVVKKKVGKNVLGSLKKSGPTSKYRVPVYRPKTDLKQMAGLEVLLKKTEEAHTFLKFCSPIWRAFGYRRRYIQRHYIPKGYILGGPPGTGKTLFVKSFASKARVLVVSMTPADFNHPKPAVVLERITLLFRAARTKAPCVLFLDEMEILGRQRTGMTQNIITQKNEEGFLPQYAQEEFYWPAKENLSLPVVRAGDVLPAVIEIRETVRPTQTNKERGQNALLLEFIKQIDQLDRHSGVIIMGATNFPLSIDAALMRNGRLDRAITFKNPSYVERFELFHFFGLNANNAKIPITYFLGRTTGLNHADIATIMNEANLERIFQGALYTVNNLELAMVRVQTPELLESQAGFHLLADLAEDPGFVNRFLYEQVGKALVHTLLEDHPPIIIIKMFPTKVKEIEEHLRERKDFYMQNILETTIKGHLGGSAAHMLGHKQSRGRDGAMGSHASDEVIMDLGPDLEKATVLAYVLSAEEGGYSSQMPGADISRYAPVLDHPQPLVSAQLAYLMHLPWAPWSDLWTHRDPGDLTPWPQQMEDQWSAIQEGTGEILHSNYLCGEWMLWCTARHWYTSNVRHYAHFRPGDGLRSWMNWDTMLQYNLATEVTRDGFHGASTNQVFAQYRDTYVMRLMKGSFQIVWDMLVENRELLDYLAVQLILRGAIRSYDMVKYCEDYSLVIPTKSRLKFAPDVIKSPLRRLGMTLTPEGEVTSHMLDMRWFAQESCVSFGRGLLEDYRRKYFPRIQLSPDQTKALETLTDTWVKQDLPGLVLVPLDVKDLYIAAAKQTVAEDIRTLDIRLLRLGQTLSGVGTSYPTGALRCLEIFRWVWRKWINTLQTLYEEVGETALLSSFQLTLEDAFLRDETFLTAEEKDLLEFAIPGQPGDIYSDILKAVPNLQDGLTQMEDFYASNPMLLEAEALQTSIASFVEELPIELQREFYQSLTEKFTLHPWEHPDFMVRMSSYQKLVGRLEEPEAPFLSIPEAFRYAERYAMQADVSPKDWRVACAEMMAIPSLIREIFGIWLLVHVGSFRLHLDSVNQLQGSIRFPADSLLVWREEPPES